MDWIQVSTCPRCGAPIYVVAGTTNIEPVLACAGCKLLEKCNVRYPLGPLVWKGGTVPTPHYSCDCKEKELDRRVT